MTTETIYNIIYSPSEFRLENSESSLAKTLSSLTLPGIRESRPPPIVVLTNESSRTLPVDVSNVDPVATGA
ncbi:hypothetical protein DERF_005083 [Dermatophagoides farinae]|uniref:Uncharacterized protein n=1 Tax=Dermatophagoides farinae TaxID=6954 RepID=A0A922I2R4_DERFA|nr:hypothetical protein DERF_005083 [Dermatophagoides farinae]